MNTTIGIDWGNVGRNVMGVLHTAGSVVLSALGAGGAAKTLEAAEAEQGLLPAWAGGGKVTVPSPETPVTVAAPDAVQQPTIQQRTLAADAAAASLARAQARKTVVIPVAHINVPKFTEGSWNMDSVVGIEHDFSVLGAAPKKVTVMDKKKAAQKGKKVAVTASRKGVSPHKSILKTSASSSARAKNIGQKGLDKAARYEAGKHVSLVGLITVLGLVPKTKALTAKQKAAVAKHTVTISKSKLAVADVKKKSEKAIALAKNLDGARNKAKPVLDKMLRTSVRGDDILGLDIPGFDVEEMPSPFVEVICGDDEGGEGGGTGVDWNSMLLPPYDRSVDPDIIPMPVRGQPLELKPGSDMVVWTAPPADAIWYDWEKNPYNVTNWSVGSSNYFVSGGRDGMIYLAENRSGKGANQFWPARGGRLEFTNDWEGRGGDTAVNQQSISYGWGPLVGNPKMTWAGLQMASNGQWFFLPENAPTWATKEADRQIAILNDQIAATNKAMVDAWNAQVLADKRAYEEAQAKADAEAALAQQAANQEADIAAARAAAQREQIDLQAQQAMLEYLRANPDAAPAGYGGGGGEGDVWMSPDDPGYGVDWGDSDDNSRSDDSGDSVDWGE